VGVHSADPFTPIAGLVGGVEQPSVNPGPSNHRLILLLHRVGPVMGSKWVPLMVFNGAQRISTSSNDSP
jgi:hypothetical protein